MPLVCETHPLWVPSFSSLHEQSYLRSKAGGICRVVWHRALNDPFLVLDSSKETNRCLKGFCIKCCRLLFRLSESSFFLLTVWETWVHNFCLLSCNCSLILGGCTGLIRSLQPGKINIRDQTIPYHLSGFYM